MGLKLKLGRNSKWMPGEPGRTRDIEVVHTVRKTVGPNIQVMVDPNNGYHDDFDNGWKLLESTADDHLYWVEELFPENVPDYSRLKDKMTAAGMKTLYADGENFGHPEQFIPYLRPRRLVDVLQLDVRCGGFLGNRAVARLGEPAGAVTIPHNWASQIGVLMALHLAKVTESAPMVEDDRSTAAGSEHAPSSHAGSRSNSESTKGASWGSHSAGFPDLLQENPRSDRAAGKADLPYS